MTETSIKQKSCRVKNKRESFANYGDVFMSHIWLYNEVRPYLPKPSYYRVLDYIFHRTVTWGKDIESIPLRHFTKGFTGRNHVKYHGVGLSETSVRSALAYLASIGLIKRQDKRGSFSSFSINMSWKPNNKMIKLLNEQEEDSNNKKSKMIFPKPKKTQRSHVDPKLEVKPGESSNEFLGRVAKNVKERHAKNENKISLVNIQRKWATLMSQFFPNAAIGTADKRFYGLVSTAKRICDPSSPQAITEERFFELMEWSIENWIYAKVNKFSWMKSYPTAPTVALFISQIDQFYELFAVCERTNAARETKNNTDIKKDDSKTRQPAAPVENMPDVNANRPEWATSEKNQLMEKNIQYALALQTQRQEQYERDMAVAKKWAEERHGNQATSARSPSVAENNNFRSGAVFGISTSGRPLKYVIQPDPESDNDAEMDDLFAKQQEEEMREMGIFPSTESGAVMRIGDLPDELLEAMDQSAVGE